MQDDSSDPTNVKRECDFLMKLKNEDATCNDYIICPFDYGKIVNRDRDDLYGIMTEYIENRLSDIKLKMDNPNDVKLYISIANHLIRGLLYMHSKGIFHNDIRPSNILIELESNKIKKLKYIDFGISCYDTDEKCMTDRHLSTIEHRKAYNFYMLFVVLNELRGGWVRNELMSMTSVFENPNHDIFKGLNYKINYKHFDFSDRGPKIKVRPIYTGRRSRRRTTHTVK